MAKIKIQSQYGVTPNELLNNKGISFRAKGLYGYIQSKSDDWDFSAEKIARQSKEGLDAIKKSLIELEDAGYLQRVKVHNEKGYFETEYILYEKPIQDKPIKGKPTVDFPPSVNPPNNSNKDLSKKDIKNKDLEKEISKEILPSVLENEKLRLEIERLNQALEEKNKKDSTKGGAAKPKKVSWLDLKEMELPEIYNEEEFRETWQSWCDFKHSRKESFTEKGIEIWFKKLETLSSRDLSISIQIVNESIANNWQGIFELKNQKSYAASKPNSQKSTTPYGAVGGVNSQGRGMFLIPLDDSTESSQGNDCIEVEGFYQSEL